MATFDFDSVSGDPKLKHYLAEQNVPVVRLDVGDAWSKLTTKEKLYAAEIAAASWAGAPIILEQTSTESPAIFKMLKLTFGAYLKDTASISDSTEKEKKRKEFWESKTSDVSFQRVLDFAVGFFANLGNYRSFGDSKIVPGLVPSEFERIVKESGSEEAVALFQEVRDRMYDLSESKLELSFGNSTYYTSDVTAEDAKFVGDFMTEQKIEGWNTRLFKNQEGDFVLKIASISTGTTTHEYKGKKIHITKGDFSAQLVHVRDHLQKAIEHAANDNQKKMLEAYVKHFYTGEIDDHKESQRHWIKDINPVVESNIGFIENYRDPHGVRSEFEGFVAVVNKEVSLRFQELVNTATTFLSELPWNKNDANPTLKEPFEKDVFTKPDFTSLEVVAFSTSGVPAGINIPNYDDIRQNEGFKNVSLGNVLRAAPSDERVTLLGDEDQKIYQTLRGPAFEVQVAGHELLGHGSGKLLAKESDGKFNFDPNTINPVTKEKVASWYLPGESWSGKFSDLSATYEECRAECVGLYLSVYPQMLKIFGIDAEKDPQGADDITYVNWLNMARAGLAALEFYKPETKKHGQAHMQARYVILRVLLEASKDNGFVKLDRTPDDKKELIIRLDRSQIKTVGVPAIYDFLLKLGVYKATADVERGRAMYNAYSEVSEEWLKYREEVLALKKPRRQFVQAVTKINSNDVELIEYDPSPRGLIESFLDRSFE